MTCEVLSVLEHLVLLALLGIGDEGYGVRILKEIATRTGSKPSRAALYIALRRLEARGLLRSRLGEATPERGGRAKRFFRLTPAGLRELHASRAVLFRMWDHVEQKLSGGRS